MNENIKEKITNNDEIINQETNYNEDNLEKITTTSEQNNQEQTINNNNTTQNEITNNEETADQTVNHIKEILDSIRPYLNMDGGDVEFVAYKDKIVYVRLTGACQACLFSDDTIKNGLYETLHADIPEIEGVINTAI